jgi:DNA polymerase III alpha subunit (gram-positive type)
MEFEKVYSDETAPVQNIVADNITEIKVNETINPDAKSETRGRHKLGCDCLKCQAKRNGETKPTETKDGATVKEPKQKTVASNISIDENDFNSIVGQYEAYKPENVVNNTTTQPEGFKVVISGYVFLMCLDAILPRAFIKVFKMFDKKAQSIDVKKIKLTKDQIKGLEPMADKVAGNLFANMPPLPALIVSMSFMYAGNIMGELD